MPSPPDHEVLFLTLHHLHTLDSDPAVAAALNALEQALNSLQRLPTTFDYTGTQQQQTYTNIAARYPHIPPSYLNQILRARLPHGPHAPRTLLANGRYSTVPGKVSTAKNVDHVKRRLRPISANIATILEQQSVLHVPPPLHRISLALLPKAFRRLKRLVGHHLPVFTTIFDHTGRYIITGSDDHLIKVWSTETAYLQHTLRGHDGDIIEIVKHPTLPLLVSVSSDTTLRVWNVNTGAALHVLDGGSKEVNAVQFSPCPDRPYLVSGGADGSVRLWNGDDFEAGFLRIPIPNRFILRHATDTRHAGSAATSRAAPPSPANDTPLPQPSSQPNSMQPAQSDSQQLSPSGIQPPTGASSAPRSEAVRDTARHAANSVVSGTPLYEVLSVCFNAGATRLAVSGTDCVAHVYAIEKPDSVDSSLPSVRLLTSLRGHSEHIIQVLFSRSGDTIVTACRDGTARMWKRTKARLPGARNRRESVTGMGSWSSKVLDCRSQIQADARSLLSGAASGSACGSIVPRMRRASFPVSLCAAIWSRSDKYLLTSSTDTKIRIWHGETGQLARLLEAHEREVYVMDCHPTDERILLSAGYDGKCILWDIETGTQLRTFSIASHIEEPRASENLSAGPHKRTTIVDGQFSSDGLSFVVSDTSGAISLFGVGSGEATALAPEEQFFSDDCTPFRRDSQRRAIHESTGLLLHLAPKGRLCNKELRPHPPELQANLSIDVSRKTAVSASSVPKVDQKSHSDAPNTVRNRNRDALLQRAKEFRENQEKEERRLLREARNARRRMIIEKEKAFLERDKPFYMPLRDFEVPDSDCEDSDEDFDGEAYVSGDSESSTSSEEEDDDEARGTQINHKHATQESKTKHTRKLISPCRKRRRPLRGSRQRDVENSNTTDSSESGDEEESPGYVDSQESDSDNSEPRKEERRRVSKGEDYLKDEPRISDGQISIGRQCPPSEALASSSVKQPTSPEAAPGLLGSSMTRSNRRMKIALSGNERIGDHVQTAASTLSTPRDFPPESKIRPDDGVPPSTNFNGAPSVGSHHGQGQPCDVIGFAGFHTPLNPSFTSERKECAEGTHRIPKPVEDHQEDTASCFRPRRSIEELMDGTRPFHGDQALHHSSIARSPEAEKGHHDNPMEIEAKPDISNAMVSISKQNGKTDANEKSLLSDSPARITRRRWRNRTRRGSAGGENPGGDDHLVDIDEVAERELEILDAQRRRRRHRKKRKRHANPDSSVGDATDNETGSQRYKAVKDDRSYGLKRQRRKKTKVERLCAGEAEDLRSCLKGSAWLRLTSNKHTYVPQLGDDVMYFPEGHAAAMEVSKSTGVEPLVDKSRNRKLGKEVLDGTTFGRGAAPLRFLISDLTYEFPIATASNKNSRGKSSQKLPDQAPVKSKTMVVLTMRLISGGKRRVAPNDQFILSYFPVDAPEYLVLTSKVETALNRSWKAADRFRILFLNEKRAWQYYTGVIRTVKPSFRSVMWNTVEVEYDNTGEKEKVSVDLVSPWELEPYDLFQGSRDIIQPFSHLSRASTVEPGLFPIIARELEAIRQMEPNWRTQLSWLDTIDSIVATEGYCDSIPCPLDLDVVMVRMCTGYYRHFCSYLHDISLLKSNAIRFYGTYSEKGNLANGVFTRLAETSERIRAQFLASFISVPSAPSYQPPVGAHTASRSIRPRPSPTELAGSGATVPGQPPSVTNGRQFPVPLTPRLASTGLAVGLHHDNSGYHIMNPALSSRMWNGIRLLPGTAQQQQQHQQQQLMYANTSLGVALPPILPGIASAGVTARGNRTVRAPARGHALRQSNGHCRRMNATSLTRGQSLSPPIAASSTPAVALGSPPGMPASYAVGHASSAAHQQSQVRMVANSSQTNNGRAVARKVTPAGSRLQSQALAKPNIQSSVALHNTSPGIDTMLVSNNGGYPINGTSSPRLPGSNPQVPFGSLNIGQPSAQVRGNRGGSTAGDGGAHSWSRSMEGAGGMFPLQASTSDSHVPVPPHGRSPSPVSPSPATGEAASVQRQQGTSGPANAGSRYHEHSTVSIAAAESTMSCGGAELQAATAESADIASEKPS